jgi:FixJ family two-component response regulator
LEIGDTTGLETCATASFAKLDPACKRRCCALNIGNPTMPNQSKATPAQGPAESSQALIFVVDDNELLVEFAVTVLQSAGYLVKGYTHPLDLLKDIKGGGGPRPALLVTDYDMPEMNGLELIVNCHQVHPTLKTILLSGTIDGSLASLHPARVHRFLGKPYQPAQIKTIVSELLRI